MQALRELRKKSSTEWATSKWVSAFTGIAVVSNRVSISHVDRNGSPAWYDLLLTVGSYSHAELRMPEIGLTLDYGPGAVVALCGNTLEHEVGDWGTGDRICYAMFMRKKVLARFDRHYVGWSTQDSYCE